MQLPAPADTIEPAELAEALRQAEPEATGRGTPIQLVRAPGRVNLIGEYTDFNLGYVLPAAIDREIRVAFVASPDRQVVLHRLDTGEAGEFNLDALPDRRGSWLDYTVGTYYFQQLLINSSSSTIVVPTTGTVRIFVASQLAYRGLVVTPAGQTAQIVLGYNGTSAAVLEAPFVGTFIAPRGAVSIGTATAQLFRGRFFGQSLEVRPGIQLTCDTGVTAQ